MGQMLLAAIPSTTAQLKLLATVATAGGAVISGIAAGQQGKAAQAMMDYQAKVQEREAKAIEQRTRFAQRRQAEEAARRMGRMAAGLGVSGAVPTVGAPLLIQAKQASEYELENLMIGYEGQTAAQRARSQAELDRLQGRIYRRKGRMKATAGYIGAGTTLLTGFNP